MQHCRLWLLIGASMSCAAAYAADSPPDAPRGFTVVTQESGVEKIVADNYAAHPKWWFSGVHLVDLDGDGNLDLFLSAHGTPGAVAALGDGKGHFAPAKGNWPPTEIHLAYDFDEDGRVDLTMTHQDGGGRWWRNRSTPGTLDFLATPIIRGAARRQAMIDIDRDGRVDWLRGTDGTIRFDLADGKGGLADSSRTLAVATGRQNECLCLPVDLDGDGQIDLLSEWGHYASPAGNSRVWLSDGKMNFRDATAAAGLPATGLAIKCVGDLNQDGHPDLICIAGKRLEIWLGDGKGTFVKKEGALSGGEGGISAPSWGLAVVTDFDNDGIPDILCNGRHFLKLYRGTGGGNFVYMNAAWGIKDLSAASVDDGLCFGDIDGDGDLDLIGYASIDGQRRIAVYRNDLPPQHWLRIRPVGLAGNRGAAGAKIRLFAPGTQHLLWYEQVAIYDSQASASYYAYAQTERHFGLGSRESVDVQIEFYPSHKTVWQRGVRPDRTVVVREE